MATIQFRPVTIPWTTAPASIADSTSRLAFDLSNVDTSSHAARTALASVLLDLFACKRLQAPRDGDEPLFDYLRRVFVEYERSYATERTRHERHLRTKIGAVLTRSVIQPDVAVLGQIEAFFGDNTERQLQTTVTALLGGGGAAAAAVASSPAASSFPSAQWADIMSRTSQWPYRRGGDGDALDQLVVLDAREKELLDGIVDSLHRELAAIAGVRSTTLTALDAALADQVRMGSLQQTNYAAARQALLATLSSIFARVPNAVWIEPTQEQYHTPVAYTNERVASFDAAFRAWKQELELAKRKLEMMQALIVSINDLIELPVLYGGSGTVSKPFDNNSIKNTPAHLRAVFDLWASRYYDEPKTRAANDLVAYKTAIEHAMGTMVGSDRAARDVATPLSNIVAFSTTADTAQIQRNVDDVRKKVAEAASEYARHLETFRRLLTTLHEVVKDATRAIDPSAVVPALDRLSDPAAHVQTVVAGKNAERVQRANELKALVDAVETAVTAIDPTIWTEQINVSVPGAAAAAAPTTMMALRAAYDDIKTRTANLGTRANNEIATMFASVGDGGSATSFITRLQLVMTALITRVQQRGALIAQRAQQLLDNQETLYNLVRQAADVIFSGSEAARLPPKSDMTGLNGAIGARQRQRVDSRRKLFADLHQLLGAFRKVYEALDKSDDAAAAAAADAVTTAAKAALDAETAFFVAPSPSDAVTMTVPNQRAFATDNAVYEQHLTSLRSVVERTQNVVYEFVRRTQRADETLALSIESLYNSLRTGADAVFSGSDVGSLPPKSDAQAVYNQIALRVETRKRERNGTFNKLAWYGLSFKQVLEYLGAPAAASMAMVNEFVGFFWTVSAPAPAAAAASVSASRSGNYVLNGDAHANRVAFLSITDNGVYEAKLLELSNIVDGSTSLLYDLVRQRQAGEHNLVFVDTLYNLLRQGVDAVYDGADPHPYPSKADAHLLLGAVDARVKQRVAALEKLFDQLSYYLDSTHRVVVALDPTIVELHDPLARTRGAVDADLDVSRVDADRRQLVAFFDRLSRARAFFATAADTNRRTFALGGTVFEQWLSRTRDLVTNSMQAAIVTLAHREREIEVKIDALDSAYTLLRVGADAIYRGEGTPAFVGRNELQQLPAQIDQRVLLRNAQRDREFLSVAYTLGALSKVINALGSHGIGQQVTALTAVTDEYIDISTERVNDSVRPDFRDTAKRAQRIKEIEAAVLAAQAQVYAMVSSAEAETRQLGVALETAYAALSNISSQLSTTPPLPPMRTAQQQESGGQQLLSAVVGRIIAYENSLGVTRRSLSETVEALARVVDALDLGTYTMSKRELFEAAPSLETDELTTRWLSSFEDQVPLATMMGYFRVLFSESGPQPAANNTFSALRAILERFVRALSMHASYHLQLLAKNRDRGRTLAEQIEALAKSVTQQATSTFGKSSGALAMQPGIEATRSMDLLMTESVRAEFEALGKRAADAWNQLMAVRTALTTRSDGSSMAVDLPIPGAGGKTFVSPDWIAMYTAVYKSNEQLTKDAFGALEAAKSQVEAEARELTKALATSKREYDQAERVVKEIERVARSYDASKTDVEMEQSRRALLLAKQQASAAMRTIKLGDGIVNRVNDANTTEQLVNIKSEVEQRVEAMRARNATDKMIVQEMLAQTKAIVQAAKSQTSNKLLQEKLEAHRNTLEAYRAAVDAFTVTAIANRNGYVSMPFNALSMLFETGGAGIVDRGHPLVGGTRSAFLCARVHDLLGILAVTPTAGTEATAPPSPFDGVPVESFKPRPDYTALSLFFVQTMRIVRQTLDVIPFGGVDRAAALFQQLLLRDVKVNDLRLEFSDNPAAVGGGARPTIVSAIQQSLNLAAWQASGNAIYGQTLDATALDAWQKYQTNVVPPGVVALVVFGFRLLVLASLAVPASLSDMTPDNYVYLETGDTTLAVMVARQVERITRIQGGVPVAAEIAHTAAADIRASLKTVATKNMANRRLLSPGQTLDTTTLAIPDVDRAIMRQIMPGLPPLGPAAGGGGGGPGGGGGGGGGLPPPPPSDADGPSGGAGGGGGGGGAKRPRSGGDASMVKPKPELTSSGDDLMSQAALMSEGPDVPLSPFAPLTRTAPSAASASAAAAAATPQRVPIRAALVVNSPYSDNAF